MKGKHHTEKSKIKMSKKLKGRKVWNKNKKGIYNTKTRKKMSDSAKIRLKNPENHPMFGKKRPKIAKKMRDKFRIINHHVYLKENSNKKMKLALGKHRQLHARAYDYIYYKYGKRGIDNYIKWFDKKYGLKDEKTK